MNDYSFGNYMYEKRKETGESQNELGRKLGVTGKAVSKWGKRRGKAKDGDSEETCSPLECFD